MALRFVEGFDHYNSASQVARKWTSVSSASFTFTTSTRHGFGNAVIPGSGITFQKTLDSQQTWFVSFAFKAGSRSGSNLRIVSARDSTTNQLDLFLQATTGRLYLARNVGATILDTSTLSPIMTDTWHFIEWKITIANSISADSNIVKVDGVQVLNLAATTDTQQSANATADNFQFTGTNTSHTFDDIVICDASGSFNNDFLGANRVRYIIANGNGNYSDLTGSDSNSTDNYLLVDDNPPDDDTTYVQSATSGHIDTYAHENTTSGQTNVRGVQISALARHTTSANTLRSLTRISSTDYEGSNYTTASTYGYLLQVHEVSPATSSQWTTSEIDGAEFGVKIQTGA